MISIIKHQALSQVNFMHQRWRMIRRWYYWIIKWDDPMEEGGMRFDSSFEPLLEQYYAAARAGDKLACRDLIFRIRRKHYDRRQ